jgi:outer membrane lipoprotein SlyB
MVAFIAATALRANGCDRQRLRDGVAESSVEFVAKPERTCGKLVLADVTRCTSPGLKVIGAWSGSSIIGRILMRKSYMALALATSLSLSACATNDRMAGDAAEGAAYGAVAGVAAGALIPGVSVIEGAAVGAGIGGLAGAVWADNNNDGYVDGYVQNGQYYTGTPQGYDPTLRSVASGALGGAALGGVAGAVIPGLGTLEGAVIGAAVGGLAGAIWADRNNDGRVDGYVYNGQYYQGQPTATQTQPVYSAPVRSGERG